MHVVAYLALSWNVMEWFGPPRRARCIMTGLKRRDFSIKIWGAKWKAVKWDKGDTRFANKGLALIRLPISWHEDLIFLAMVILPHLLSPTISSANVERKPGAFTCSSYRISGRNVTVSVFQRMQNEKGRFRHLLLRISCSVISPLTSRNILEVRCSSGSYATIRACS